MIIIIGEVVIISNKVIIIIVIITILIIITEFKDNKGTTIIGTTPITIGIITNKAATIEVGDTIITITGIKTTLTTTTINNKINKIKKPLRRNHN